MNPTTISTIQDISQMNVKHLKQELTKRGLPTDGLKSVLVERLKQATQQPSEKNNKISNEAFRSVYPQLESTRKKVTEQEEEVIELEARLAVVRTELATTKTELCSVQKEFKELEPRLSFNPKLPTSVLLSILGQLGKKAGERAACVKREWRDVVGTAKALGMYDVKVLSVAVGGGEDSDFTVFCLSTGVFSCGGGVEHEYDDSEDEDAHEIETDLPALGHGGGTELIPRIIQAFTGK